MKRFFATLLVVIMLVSMIPAATLAATQYATVVGGWLRLRDGASFDAETITSYYTDTVVEILGTSGAWYRVKTPDGRTGYMHGDYLKLGNPGGGTANAYVTSHNGYGVRLRMGPGTGYRVINTYAVGTPVTVLERGNIWSRISINGTIGYMMTQFLNFGTPGGDEPVQCYASIWSANGYGVRLRTGPGTNYSKIGVYSVGTVVAVLEKGAVWDRIRVGSRTGWMMNEFLRYQNNNEVTSVSLNTLEPTVGTVMSVKAMSPSNATVSYAWIVDGTVKGTDSTYTVSSYDVGKTIQVRINGVGNYTGSAVSVKTNAVISNKQISGLKLSTTAPVAGDVIRAAIVPHEATVAYVWKVDGYQVSDRDAYKVKDRDVGKVIELIVTGTGDYSGTLSASTSAVVPTSVLTGVSIRNESNSTHGAAPMVGDQLTAVVTPSQATAKFHWMRNGRPIRGATDASYVLTDADLGARMSVTAIGTGAYCGEKTAAIDIPVAPRPVKPAIDDYAMPDAMIGQTYATQLTAQGGGEITWKISDGHLPRGLHLSDGGAITGTPVRDGSYSFTVKATNSAGSDKKTFTITVLPAATPKLTVNNLTIPAQTEDYAQPAPVAVSITNVGRAEAHLQQLWMEGANASCFAVNEDGSSVIAAGATDTTWTVQPAANLLPGTYKADFIVRYDDGETASASVSFTVNAKSVTPEPEPEPEPDYDSKPDHDSRPDHDFRPDHDSRPDHDFRPDHDARPDHGMEDESSPEPETPVTSYAVSVSGGVADRGSYQAGETVAITANMPEEGKVFSGWTASGGVSFADASAAATTFIMPAFDVTVTANYAAVEIPEVKTPELIIEQIVLPTVKEGYDRPAAYEVKITNIGSGDANLTRLYTEGGNAGSFTVNEDGRTTIAAGRTDTSWTIRPVTGLTAGTYSTRFVAEYNGTAVWADVTFVVEADTSVTDQLTIDDSDPSGTGIKIIIGT